MLKYEKNEDYYIRSIMNEMYSMSIVSHYYSVVGLLVVIFLNFWMMRKAVDIKAYKRQMSLFTPIGSMAIASIIFTGIIMMAAKHLDFTIENIIMIVFSILILALEVTRVKRLKYLNPKIEDALKNYKKLVSKLLLSELVLTVSISIWMLL